MDPIKPSPLTNMRIDGARLWQGLMTMAEIGPGLRGGNNRQTLTDADRAGRLLFQRWAEEAGMRVTVDTMGNMFARRAGRDPDAAPVLVGSHLDTQPTGGRYDGVLGVLAALEIVRTLNELDVTTERPIEVVNWTNEEGTRFAPSLLGSGVFTGHYDLAWAYAREDAQGQRFDAELARIGFHGDLPAATRPLAAYFELHIEQGPILEAEGLEIGVVTHGQGQRWLQVTLLGQESHTGSTPMAMRRNAGRGLAQVTELVHDIAMRHQPIAVGTIGHIEVYPNSRNIIPGKVVCTIDFRSPDRGVLTAMDRAARAGIAEIATNLRLEHVIEPVSRFDPITFDAGCVALVREAATRLGYRHRDLVSGAGHDACHLSHVVPSAMVMCPCVGGLSHNEDEAITPEWATAGANVLCHAVVEAAGL